MHQKPQSEKLGSLVALAGRTMTQIDRLTRKLRDAGSDECGSASLAYHQIMGIRHTLSMQQIAAKGAEHEAYMTDRRATLNA